MNVDRLLAWRKLGRVVDGRFVAAPQRLERAWAWLMARRAPMTPPRRITVLGFWVLMAGVIVCDWLFPRGMFTAMYWLWIGWIALTAVCAVAMAGFWIRRTVRRRR